MSTLSGLEIEKLVRSGDIAIEPFFSDQLNPNSYNLRLSNRLLVYDLNHTVQVPRMPGMPEGPKEELRYLDMAEPLKFHELVIPPRGMILMPGVLYLGSTVEYTATPKHVPVIEGRSSIGRLGLCIHVTAGFGDVGFKGHWTLEITVVHPVKIYPDVEICQIAYSTVVGETVAYDGKYSGQGAVPRASEFYKDLQKLRSRYGGLSYSVYTGVPHKAPGPVSMETKGPSDVAS